MNSSPLPSYHSFLFSKKHGNPRRPLTTKHGLAYLRNWAERVRRHRILSYRDAVGVFSEILYIGSYLNRRCDITLSFISKIFLKALGNKKTKFLRNWGQLEFQEGWTGILAQQKVFEALRHAFPYLSLDKHGPANVEYTMPMPSDLTFQQVIGIKNFANDLYIRLNSFNQLPRRTLIADMRWEICEFAEQHRGAEDIGSMVPADPNLDRPYQDEDQVPPYRPDDHDHTPSSSDSPVSQGPPSLISISSTSSSSTSSLSLPPKPSFRRTVKKPVEFQPKKPHQPWPGFPIAPPPFSPRPLPVPPTLHSSHLSKFISLPQTSPAEEPEWLVPVRNGDRTSYIHSAFVRPITP
ncbi:hypothetical protein SISNIDRAFT_487216 [Sistotremastrum niveocremeum HHB9708]|uniref:Uncharacterized protein n=1 Tax=Sistotremastrum niveocremeum HHB9708 TaxID=1314777 RepID=A0A164SJF9_9AGAM|nr:hypothetical protein SISNIDRAFT_487216 [Sistotremastrum niveocremeum HHB9708]